jgi:hypothetical protein
VLRLILDPTIVPTSFGPSYRVIEIHCHFFYHLSCCNRVVDVEGHVRVVTNGTGRLNGSGRPNPHPNPGPGGYQACAPSGGPGYVLVPVPRRQHDITLVM